MVFVGGRGSVYRSTNGGSHWTDVTQGADGFYLHADLQIKQRALDRTAPPQTTLGRYRPPDALLTFLESL